MTHYFYKTTNMINGEFYYGVTNGKDKSYKGSGTKLIRAFKKYGRKNFRREDLKIFNTAEEAYQEEARVVTEELVDNRQCYNIKVGGWGGIGQKKTSEHKKKIAESVTETWKDRSRVNANGGRKPKHEDLIKLYEKYGKIECAKMLDEDPQNLYHQYRRAKATDEKSIT